MDSFRNLRQIMGEVEADGNQNHCTTWAPPMNSQYRLDVDAGFDSIRDKYSVGMVVRDAQGRVRGAKACPIRFPGSVACAELLAIRMGMDFCLGLGLDNVCIFSDSLAAIKAVKESDFDLSHSGGVASEVRAMLEGISFLSIHHMRRTANNVAHALAQRALVFSVLFEWIDGVLPSWLVNIVSRDLSII
ncbi:uncharacterized protein [Primulina eburnea]|uniref:uncharacterized protein n=1 Tax=Primulina eburnea TaxID=1245227 RepID=UPI003C6C2AD3